MRRVVKWFKPGVEMGWKKTMPLEERRQMALEAHGGDTLATARALQALANVSKDKPTKIAAEKDAKYFYRQHRVE